MRLSLLMNSNTSQHRYSFQALLRPHCCHSNRSQQNGRSSGVLSEKLGGGVPPAYQTKICDILHPIYDLTKIRNPIYELPDPYIKVLFQTGVIISIPYLRPKWPKLAKIVYTLKKTLSGAAHTYIAHIRKYYPPPTPGGRSNNCSLTLARAPHPTAYSFLLNKAISPLSSENRVLNYGFNK